MWSCRAWGCSLKRSMIYLHWACFSSFKTSLLEMEPAANALVLLYNLQLIDNRFLPIICWRHGLYGRTLEEFTRVLHFLVKTFKNAHGFTLISIIRRPFHTSVVSKTSFSAHVWQSPRYCLTAAGQILGSAMSPLKWTAWTKNTHWQMKHDWFLFRCINLDSKTTSAAEVIITVASRWGIDLFSASSYCNSSYTLRNCKYHSVVHFCNLLIEGIVGLLAAKRCDKCQ